MKRFFVLYGDHESWFACYADDAAHAVEQCNDFTPRESVHGVWVATQDDSWARPTTQGTFPVGTTVLGAKGTKAATLRAVVRGYGRCQLAGCRSATLHLRWPDGHVTRPCTDGLVYDRSKRCWRIG